MRDREIQNVAPPRQPLRTTDYRRLPPSDAARSGFRAAAYVAVLGAMPAVLFGLHYQVYPVAALIVLPRAITSAASTAARRWPTHRDVPPAVVGAIMSAVVWVAIACSLPALFARDPAQTILVQIVLGIVLTACGPGFALEWAGLPEQVYYPVQSPPPHALPSAKNPLRGSRLSDPDDVSAAQAADYARHHARSGFESAETRPDGAAWEPPTTADSPADTVAGSDIRQTGPASPFFWGGVGHDASRFSNINRFLIGSSGSGKTLAFRQLMLTTLPWPRALRRRMTAAVDPAVTAFQAERQTVFQSVVYDAKSQQIPRLEAFGFTVGEDLYLLDPTDDRSHALDISSGIRTATDIEEFTKLIVADAGAEVRRDQTSDHFTKTSQLLIGDVITILGRSGAWRLRDLVLIFDTPGLLEHVLSPGGKPTGGMMHLKGDQEGASTRSTLRSYFRQLRVVAAVWDHLEQTHGSQRVLSLDEWFEQGEGTVLLVPDCQQAGAVTQPFNRFLFRVFSELLFTPQQLATKRQRTILLDELPTMGRVPTLEDLLTRGREYGVQLTLGVQDINQLFTAYGTETANTLVGVCSFRAYLKCSGTSAKWCSQEIGEQDVCWDQEGYSYARTDQQGQGQSLDKSNHRVWLDNTSLSSGFTHNVNRQERTQATVLPSEISGLPDIEYSGIVSGFYSNPNGQLWKPEERLADVMLRLPPEGAPRAEGEEHAFSADAQELRRWDDEDYERLGISPMEDLEVEAEPKAERKSAAPKRPRRPSTGPGSMFD